MHSSNLSERRDSEPARPLSPTSFAFDTSMEFDAEVPRNFQDLTMKFQIMDPEVYRRLGRIQRDERSHSSGKSERQRPASQDRREVRQFPQERIIDTVPESVQLQSHAEGLCQAVNILEMVMDRQMRALYRTTFTSIIMMGIQRLKFRLELAKRAPVVQPVAADWMYAKLFSKRNPTEEELTYREFLNHCASRIQCNFKMYITRKRHLLAMRRLHLIKAAVRGWKTRQIFNSGRVKTMRQGIAGINRTISECEINPKLMGQLTYLYKELQLNITLFNDQFSMLQETGGWVFQRNLNRNQQKDVKPKHNHSSISNYETNYRTQASSTPTLLEAPKEAPMEAPRRRRRQFAAEKSRQHLSGMLPTDISQIENNSSLAQNSTGGDDRPIKSTGVYALAEGEVLVGQDQPASKIQKKSIKNVKRKKQPQQPKKPEGNTQAVVRKESASGSQPTVKTDQQDNDKKEQPGTANEKKPVTWLVRKQKYDPRKAILEEKKRKAEKAKEQVKAEEAGDDYGIKNRRPSTPPPLTTSTGEKAKAKPKKGSKKQLVQQIEEVEVPLPKASQKSHRKAAQPKVNCWSRKPDPYRQERQRDYYSQHTEDISETPIEPIVLNRQGRHPLRQHPLHMHLGELQISNIMPVQINFEEHFKTVEVEVNDVPEQRQSLKNERQEKFRTNIQRLITQLQQKKQVRRQGHKTIDELSQTYQTQYMTRYKRLMPKLQRLFFQRSQQTYPLVPMILHSSLFGQTVSGNLDWQTYRRIYSKLERQHKGLVESVHP